MAFNEFKIWTCPICRYPCHRLVMDSWMLQTMQQMRQRGLSECLIRSDGSLGIDQLRKTRGADPLASAVQVVDALRGEVRLELRPMQGMESRREKARERMARLCGEEGYAVRLQGLWGKVKRLAGEAAGTGGEGLN
jgi:hypothetical protein